MHSLPLSLSLSLFFFVLFIAVSSILPPNRQVLCAHQMFPSLLQHPICVTHEGCQCAYLSHASLPIPLQISLLSMCCSLCSLSLFCFFVVLYCCKLHPSSQQTGAVCSLKGLLLASLLQHPICVRHEECQCAYLSHASLPIPLQISLLSMCCSLSFSPSLSISICFFGRLL